MGPASLRTPGPVEVDRISALPPEHWLDHIDYLNSIVQTLPGESHLAVLDAGHAWIANPEGFTRARLAERSILAGPRPPAGQHQAVAEPGPATSPGPAAEAGVEAPAAGEPGATPTGAVHRAPSPSGPADRAQETASTTPTPEQDVDLVEQWAADVWVDVGRSIDPKLVAGPDWSGLAAALDRASRAGYDVQQHLPRLAARSPLPDVRPARALHYRLVDECAAAITPTPPQLRHTDDQQRAAAALARLKTEADLHDNQPAAAPDRSRAPADRALHAAQDRMRSEGRRRDNEQTRTAPAGPRTPDRTPPERGSTPTRPAFSGDRLVGPADRRGPQR